MNSKIIPHDNSLVKLIKKILYKYAYMFLVLLFVGTVRTVYTGTVYEYTANAPPYSFARCSTVFIISRWNWALYLPTAELEEGLI